MLSVAVVDDHPIVSEGLQYLISGQKDMRIVGVFSDSKNLYAWLENNQVHILLLDIYLPDVNGLDICKELTTKYPNIKIIGISSQNEGLVISQMINNGAQGYLLKNADSKEILEAIREVASGRKYYCSSSKLALKNLKISLTQIPKITRREKEVLLLVAQGLTTNEIANKLFISPHTVESHRKNLMGKFDTKSMSSVINRVKDLGLI